MVPWLMMLALSIASCHPFHIYHCSASLSLTVRYMAAHESCEPTNKYGKMSTKHDKVLPGYNDTIIALIAYRSIHGDLVLPRRFIIPQEAPYPLIWQGMDLSSAVYSMKWWKNNVQHRPERVSELSELGFVWGRLQDEWNLVLEALATYSSIHGNVHAPLSFVVPYNETQWPVATWGLALGNCVYRIRQRSDFLTGPNGAERREQLKALGFAFDINELRFQQFYDALAHFSRQEHYGKYGLGRAKAVKVPTAFIVPESMDWPEEMWGYPLGERCNAVRHKGVYVKNHPDRRRLLEELGFCFAGNTDLGWLEVVLAAAIYSRLHNRVLDVPYHFCVPSPPDANNSTNTHDIWPWPEHLWGLPLGQRLKEVRLTGVYLRGEKGEKRKRQLNTLGFNWTPKRGRKRARERG